MDSDKIISLNFITNRMVLDILKLQKTFSSNIDGQACDALHCRGGAESTREGNVKSIVDDASAVFIKRENANSWVEL